MKNRVISMVLVVSMLLSMCQTVFAETFTEQPEQNATEVISNDITIEANADSPDDTSQIIEEDVIETEETDTEVTYELDTDDFYNSDYVNWKQEQAMELKGENPNIQLFSLNRQAGNQISNEYLNLITQTGTFSYYTTGGNPDSETDDYKLLLYDGTSHTVLNIDGTNYTYSSYDSEIEDETSLYSYNEYDDVKVEQIFSFVYNPYTKRNDTVEFKYVMTNNSDSVKNIGARIFFDIMLADNDQAPFKIPGYGDVTTETEFTKDNLFQVWQSFDNLQNPTVVASGTLYNNINEKPDKVQFLNYGNGANYAWDCDINEGEALGDTAVNFYFNPTSVQPGETKIVKTYYGLSSLQGGQNINLGLQAFAPAELVKDNATNSYLANPFTINGFVENKTDDVLTNVTATLNLPEELTTSDEISISLDSIESGENKPIAWQITALPQYKDNDIKFSVTLSAEEVPDETTEFYIHLPRLLDDYGNYPEEKDGILSIEAETDAKLEIVEDIDYFKFVAPETGTYSFESLSDTSLKGELYESSTIVEENANSGTEGNFYIISELEKNKTYYLKISANDEGVACDYSVQVNKLTDDAGNKYSSAKAINEKEDISGIINYPCDIDVYTFDASKSGWYTVAVSGELEANFELYSSDEELLFDAANSSNNQIAYKLVEGETYYVKVMHVAHVDKDDAGTGTYSLYASYDETPPVVDSISPNINRLLNGTIDVSVSANDNIDVDTVSLKYSYDQEVWIDYETKNADNGVITVFNVDTKAFNDGTVYLSAEAKDETGNVSINNPINAYLIDNTPPEKIEIENALSTVGANYISWGKVVAEDAQGYILYRSSNNGQSYEILSDITDINTLFYVDTNVSTGVDYIYKITAYDALRQEGSPEISDSITTNNDMQSDIAIKNLTVVPDRTALFVGEYSQISANIEYITGEKKDVTSMLAYNIDDTLMSVDATGRIRALAAGESNLSVTVGEQVITIPFVIKSLTASISSNVIVGNGKEQISVKHYTLEGTSDVTNSASYTVDNPEVLTITSTGEVQALTTGSAIITVTYDGQVETISVSVFAPPGKVTEVNVANDSKDIPVNQVLTWISTSATDKYNIYIWKDGFEKPSYPTSSNLTATMYRTNLEYNTKYCWQVESVNQYASTLSDIFTFSTLGLPDLECVDVTVPTEAFSESEITVSWEVKNTGTRTTDNKQWTDYVYLSPSANFDSNTAVFLGQKANYSYLDVGESYKNEASYTIPRGTVGKYYIFVMTDRNYHLREIDDSNNTGKSDGIDIELCPQPDLKITEIDTSLKQIISGNKLTVNWDVENIEDEIPESANISGWIDNIYLSSDETLSNDDVLLSSASISILKNNTSSSTHIFYTNKKYSASKEVTIPQNIFGDYYIIVSADVTDKVYENDVFNNVKSSKIKITLDPPADITVSELEAENTMVSNGKYTISWTDINEGSRDVSGEFWSDRIYIDKNKDINMDTAYLLKTVNGVKADKGNSVEITIPANYEGEYYLHIISDYAHKIFEYNTYDNNAVSQKITVELRDLPDISAKELIAPAEARANDTININYTVSNIGLGSTIENAWKDTIYISEKEIFDDSARQLTVADHSGNVSANAEYASSLSVKIPSDLLGTYYLYIKADSNNRVQEIGDDSNNTTRSEAITISPRLASDLQVTEAKSTGTDLSAGAVLPITWTVTNTDTGVASGSWTDSVYLSTSAETPYERGYVKLGSLRYDGALAQNETYTASQNFILSGRLNGTYYIYVVTDTNDNIYENENENNNFKKVSLITIDGETGNETGDIRETIDIVFTKPCDLKVESVDAPATAEAGTEIEVKWKVTNVSENETNNSSWSDAIYIVEENEDDYTNGTKLSTKSHVGKLNQNDSYEEKMTVKLPHTLSGNYKIVVVTDMYGSIIDAERENNALAKTEVTDVKAAKAVDFSVELGEISERVTTGQPLSLSWEVTNSGEASATGKWYDSVYLSYTETTLDMKLKDVQNPKELGVNESYQQTTTVTLPVTIKGPMYLVVKSNNSTSAVYEVNFDNNTDIKAVELTEMAPVDLTVANISVPDVAYPGNEITVNWDVVNLSTQSLDATMTDNVYISADTEWDINDIPVGELTRKVSLAGNAKNYESLTVAMPDYETLSKFSSVLTDDMPGVQEGQYYVIVRTDVKNQVNENNKTNNRVASANTLDATVPRIEIGEKESGVLYNQNEKFYRFSSNGGESVNIDLSCAESESVNEVYVSYNKVPTAYDYDYKFSEPMAANQSVVVPVSQKGEYYVYVKNVSVNKSGTDFDLSVDSVDYGVLDIYPKTSAQGKVTIKLSGSLLESNLTATLSKGKIKVKAEEIYYYDSSNVYATFDLTYSPYGTYTLTVDCNGNVSTLADCFTIENTTKGELSVTMNAPTSYQVNSIGSATIRYKNVGNTDIAAPILVVQADNVMFKKADETEFSSEPMVVYGYNNDGPAGILPPGGESAYNFAFKATSTGNAQYNIFTYEQIEDLGIEKITLSEASTDEDRINYVLQKEIGTSGKTYTDALSKIASHHSQFGYRTNDVDDLLLLLYNSVMGLYTNTEISTMEDLKVNAGGTETSFIRKYLSSPLERNGKSLFGYGWKTQFDGEALCENGTITITYPNGLRLFEEQDGIYKELAGNATATVSNGEIAVSERNGSVTVYGSNGKISSVTDATGERLSINYNGEKISSIVYPDATLSFTYNGDYVEKITSDTGKETTYKYSGDYLTSVTTENGTVTYEYDLASVDAKRNSLVKINYIDGSYTSFDYDSSGRLSKEQNNSGVGAKIYKYGNGGKITVIDALGASNQMYFDHNGVLARIIDADGITTETVLSDDNLSSEMTYALFAKSKYEYNEYGDVVKYTNPLGYSISTSYDELGNAVSLIDEKGMETKYSYDDGKLKSITYSDGTVEKYEYNADNQILNYTDRNGGSITYSYDAKGNLSSKEYSDGTSVSYTYDDKNNIVSVSDSTGATTFEYGDKNNITKVIYSDGKTVGYEYDSIGRKSRMTDTENAGTNYSYDSLGRLYEISDDEGNMIVKYSYEKMNRVSKKTNGNGTYTSYSYTPSGNIKKLVNYAPDGIVNSEFVYSYDRFGNISEIKTKNGTYYYEYDLLRQLVSATDVDGTVTRYSYDATGNRISEQIGSDTTYYTTNELNQYTKAGNTNYSYDAAGNLITKTDAEGTTTYSYDLEGNLVNVNSPLGIWEYSYNAMGQRTSMTKDDTVTTYLNDMSGLGNVIAEYKNGEVTKYIHGIGLEMLKNSTGEYYYDFNMQGSVIGLTNSIGQYVNKYSYSPTGVVNTISETINNPFKYSGRYGIMDDGNGLNYIRERYYDSTIGKFIALDNYGQNVSTNGYLYSNNNSLYYIDANGDLPFLAVIAIAAGIGAITSGGATVVNNKLTGEKWHNNLGWAATGGAIAGATAPFWGGAAGVSAAAGGAIAIGGGFIGAGIESFGANGKQFNSDFWIDTGVGTLFNTFGLGFGGFVDDFAIKGVRGRPAKGFFKYWFASKAAKSHRERLAKAILQYGLGDFFWSHMNNFAGTLMDLFGSGFAQFLMDIFGSLDPNDMIGPVSYGDANWVAKDAKLDYMIRCENDPEFATAPVQYLTITQELDDSLDLRTFRLGSYGFGGQVFEVPENKALYQTRLDLTEEIGLYIDVWAGLDIVSGVATWTFTAIDPETGAKPVDPLVGFLPVNNKETGDGEGFVTYTVQPKKTVENGEIIDAVATIIFDNNAPIDTPKIFNTIDTENPVSELQTTQSVSSTETVLEWTAEDNADGSGYAGADVYVSVDMTPFVLAMSVLNEKKAIYSIEPGKKYEFFVRAKDNAGNAEEIKAEGEKAVDNGFVMQTVQTPVAKTILSGISNEIQFIELTSATDGADIFYTIDGETPTIESEKYTDAFSVEDNTTIKAIAVKQGMNQSNVMEFLYERPKKPVTTSESAVKPGEDGWTGTGIFNPLNNSPFGMSEYSRISIKLEEKLTAVEAPVLVYMSGTSDETVLYYNEERGTYDGIVKSTGTFAEIWENITIEDGENTELIYGNLDISNTNLDSFDALMAEKIYLNRIPVTDMKMLLLSDVNGDNVVDSFDKLEILKYYLYSTPISINAR